MPLKITKTPKNPVTASVTKDVVDSKEKTMMSSETTQEEVDPPAGLQPKTEPDQPWCTVGFDASYTHNLGNYQSCRVGVSLSIPCPHSEIDGVYEFAQTWVNERMTKAIEELNE